ncbi:MAG: hypothetical protein ACRDGL_09710 [Candidatus Limnocylindrales bacterium]
MVRAVRLIVKQHAFELGAVVVATLLVTVAAAVVALRLTAIDLPASCLAAVGPASGACLGPVTAFAAIDEPEAGKVFAAMAALPLIAGVLAGAPIVARELESSTLQTSWWLAGSRTRWLLRKLATILLVLLVVMALATMAATALESARELLRPTASIRDLSLYGPPVVVRAFAAFGVAVLVGAVLGRTLPALLLSGVVIVGIAVLLGIGQEQWMYGQREYIDAADWDGISYGAAFVAPSGERLDEAAAFALVPPDVSDGTSWLSDHGYRLINVGIRDDVALGWATYDMLVFAGVGAATLVAAGIVVNRRRPM